MVVEFNGEFYKSMNPRHTTFTYNLPFVYDDFSTEPEDNERRFCLRSLPLPSSATSMPKSGLCVDASGEVANALPLFNTSPLDMMEEEVVEMEVEASMEAASKQETAVAVPMVLLSEPVPAAPKPDEVARSAVATLDGFNSTVVDEVGSATSNCGAGDSPAPLRKLKKKKKPKKKETTKPQSTSDHVLNDTPPEGTEMVCAPLAHPPPSPCMCQYPHPHP